MEEKLKRRTKRHPWQKVATKYAFPRWKDSNPGERAKLETEWKKKHPENVE
jgi:hypothetical protein